MLCFEGIAVFGARGDDARQIRFIESGQHGGGVLRLFQPLGDALGDALGDRNLPALLRRLDEELWATRGDKKKSVMGLLYGLVSKVRSLLFAREMMDAGWIRSTNSFPQFKPQLERVPVDAFPEDRRLNPLSLNPFVLFRAAAQAKNWSCDELVRALDLLLTCNRRLVSSSLDDTFLLQQTLTQIVAREKAAA